VKDAFLLGVKGLPIEFSPDQPAMLSGVAILADSTWATFTAARALEVQWDGHDASTDSWTTATNEAKRLAGMTPQQVLSNVGDVDSAFERAEKTIAGFYAYPFLAHA